jgi:hypothetical protein
MLNKLQLKELEESNNTISTILEKKTTLLILKFKNLLNTFKN